MKKFLPTNLVKSGNLKKNEDARKREKRKERKKIKKRKKGKKGNKKNERKRFVFKKDAL